MTKEEILTWDEIEKTTVYVLKVYPSGRYTGTRDELKQYQSCPRRDFGVLAEQPTEKLQHFWKAFHKFGDTFTYCMSEKEFYDMIYSRSPYAFDEKPERRQKIMTLSEILAKHADTDDIRVEHCGNHRKRNWTAAMTELGRDYDVINITKECGTMLYTIAGTKDEIEELSVKSNEQACRELF